MLSSAGPFAPPGHQKSALKMCPLVTPKPAFSALMFFSDVDDSFINIMQFVFCKYVSAVII